MSDNNETTTPTVPFTDLGLSPDILKGLEKVGYETPSPIQAEIIPYVLQGKDVLGQAQTGTGKTAAFALPILSKIDLNQKDPQVLVLAPTRELAIQVAEAFQKYASFMKGFHVLPIYGGQSYDGQLRQLRRGAHVVVGTPGRVMDHMRRKTLRLDGLKTLVLDEADEMLRMGFIDDVEWVLEQTPPTRQIALFSATMPQQIRKIASRYLNKPEQITIQGKTTTAVTIRQRYWMVSGRNKLDALTRILEAETFDGIIVFVRTKTATVELAEKLQARGYAAAALNGDIAQNQREQIVSKLKKGQIDILIGTDVVARGLDVERISHVINYDVPHDTESYVHRIGRTGRAGRSGEAILFVAPREKRMLLSIERATKQKVELFVMPSTEDINDKRIAAFKQKITDTLATDGLELFTKIVEQYEEEHNIPAQEVAAALAKMVQGSEPFLLKDMPKQQQRNDEPRDMRRERGERSAYHEKPVAAGFHRYRLAVGSELGVRAANIVGAIANEAGIESEFINNIVVRDDHSTVDLPEGMPDSILKALKKARIAGQTIDLEQIAVDSSSARKSRPSFRRGGGGRGDAQNRGGGNRRGNEQRRGNRGSGNRGSR
ncbi:MAG: DEAD/DEAH box helicase [Mariprofundaceae bacterium]|nr:DEAD/DEAH box helicase [Mariprofundaceae bacterium]